MVATAKIDSVNVHTTVISPVVGQSQNKLHVGRFSSLNNDIKLAQINLDSSISLEPLENSVLGTSVVLGQATRRECPVVVMESPGTDNLETSILGSFQAEFDILVVVGSPLRKSVFTRNITWCRSYNVEGEIVGIASSKEEILSVKREFRAVGGDKTSWDGKCRRASKGCCDDGGELHGKTQGLTRAKNALINSIST